MNWFSLTIREGIYQYGVVQKNGAEMFAYEVNGFGDYKLIDDANLASLLSLPYLQFIDASDPIYKHTRKFLLSNDNPYFFKNEAISGIGSSHTSSGSIWPLALMTQIITSHDDEEIKNCLSSLLISAKHDLLHESFSVKNPSSYTREWFAWANSFFGEMIVDLHQKKHHLVQK